MAGAPAGLPAGIRLSDHISLGVIAKTFPLEEVRHVLAATGKAGWPRPARPASANATCRPMSWSTTPSRWRSI
jgi:hypothetical protein